MPYEIIHSGRTARGGAARRWLRPRTRHGVRVILKADTMPGARITANLRAVRLLGRPRWPPFSSQRANLVETADPRTYECSVEGSFDLLRVRWNVEGGEVSFTISVEPF